MALGRFCSMMALVCTWLSAAVSPGHSAKDTPSQTASGLPVPRYVSLKSDHVYDRADYARLFEAAGFSWRPVRRPHAHYQGFVLS